MKHYSLATLSASFMLLAAAPGHAQALRTWVSGAGDDANPCSRTAPCHTFAGAISKTAAGGEINVLDGGGYGAVTITRSISIVAVGAQAGVSAPQTNGITIRAGANDVVSLDGVNFNGLGSGLSGINIVSAGKVDIRNCTATGFLGAPGAAINIAASAPLQVQISNCTLFGNNGGVWATIDQAPNAVHLDRVRVNGTNTAVQADGNAAVFVSNSAIAGNNLALNPLNKGQITSFGNNVLAGNTSDGKPTATLPLQ
ncbi:MAG: hypothetical protein E6G97_03000 [Alphaproteobacteria bacterium]|nr:MAG: hypothetical protein E6G97_03000 [Alphaproteobacteria bacterium]